MNKIDFKKPKYILPLLVLPFILLIAYVMQSWYAPKKVDTSMESVQEVNPGIQPADLSRVKQKGKLDALKEAFQKSSDYSSIQEIDQEQKTNEVGDNGSLYSEKEMETIDSLNKVTRIKKAEIDKVVKFHNFKNYGDNETENENDGETSSERVAARKAPKNSKMSDEMEVFKKQMNYIDSLQNPEKHRTPGKTVRQKTDNTEKPIEVLKASNPAASYFNTVSQNKMSNDITAIVDERVKIVSGSRVRIRLLDDVVINSSLLKKGTYLFGNVTNFRAQRIMIDINSIICNGQCLKVNLSVFDNDGQEGLFVPSSVFRDLTKNIGSQAGSQNIQVEQQSNTAAEFAASAMQDVYRSATQAISKEVKKNKALIKYNTQVFLINTKEKSKDNQSNEE